MPADGVNTTLATEVGKRGGIKGDWEAMCDRIPGCNEVKDQKLGSKQTDDGGNDNQPDSNDSSTNNQGNGPDEGPEEQPNEN